MDMFREQFKFNLMARDGRPLASKTTTKGTGTFVVVGCEQLLLVIVLAGDITVSYTHLTLPTTSIV